jgi:hypothetical protein
VISLNSSGFQQPSSRKHLCGVAETSASSGAKRVKVGEELGDEAERDTIEIPAGSGVEQYHATSSWAWAFLTDEQRGLPHNPPSDANLTNHKTRLNNMISTTCINYLPLPASLSSPYLLLPSELTKKLPHTHYSAAELA